MDSVEVVIRNRKGKDVGGLCLRIEGFWQVAMTGAAADGRALLEHHMTLRGLRARLIDIDWPNKKAVAWLE